MFDTELGLVLVQMECEVLQQDQALRRYRLSRRWVFVQEPQPPTVGYRFGRRERRMLDCNDTLRVSDEHIARVAGRGYSVVLFICYWLVCHQDC